MTEPLRCSQNAEAWNNRGNCLQALRRFDEASASYGKAIAINPAYAEADLKCRKPRNRARQLRAGNHLFPTRPLTGAGVC